MAETLWPDADSGFASSWNPRSITRPHVEYQTRPIEWITDKLKIPRDTLVWSDSPIYSGHVWDGTPDPIAKILRELAEWKNVGVESATTTGKTHLGACIILWFLACFEDSLVVTVAPKEDQLRLHIWKEVGRLWPRFRQHFPSAELLQLQIRMDPKVKRDAWSAVGFVAGVSAGEVASSATRAQGFHAEHMLIVFEETPGIAAAIMTAFRNTCMAPHNLRLAFGNPDHRLDELHRFATAPKVEHVRISALDHPNVVLDDAGFIPGAVSKERIAERREEDGEDSPMFESRVRGISPAQAANALIRLEWCEAAAKKWDDEAMRAGYTALGVDVAQSTNGDKAAIAEWNGRCLAEIEAFRCPNATELGDTVYGRMKLKQVENAHVGVDPVGVGAATINRLWELAGYDVQSLNGGTKAIERAQRAPDGREMDWAPDAGNFQNLRAQMYWQMREDLRKEQIALPMNLQLFRELTTPTYRDQAGRIVLESKDEIRKRLGNSPDLADAAVYGNWVRPRMKEGEKMPEKYPEPNRDPEWESRDLIDEVIATSKGAFAQFPEGF